MFGKPLKPQQQRAMYGRTLDVLSKIDASVKWISFEPLSFNAAPALRDHGCPLDWAVIGAASNGKTYYQPDPEHVESMLNVLDDYQVPVFFKGNLIWSEWREDYPSLAATPPEPRLEGSTQLSLF